MRDESLIHFHHGRRISAGLHLPRNGAAAPEPEPSPEPTVSLMSPVSIASVALASQFLLFCFALLMTSAAVSLVMEGVRDPVAAPKGVYRDGGMSDYHFGAEIDPDDGLALYPHFFPELAPGWFDKKLRWRRTRGLRRTIVIAPSPTFVAQLPLAKIPDRQDFARLDDDARIRVWRAVLDATRRMGDALAALLERDRLAMVARPLR